MCVEFAPFGCPNGACVAKEGKDEMERRTYMMTIQIECEGSTEKLCEEQLWNTVDEISRLEGVGTSFDVFDSDTGREVEREED